MTSNIPDVSERLEHTFANWQTMYFMYEAYVEGLKWQGLISDPEAKSCSAARRLASIILNNKVENLEPDDWRPTPKLREATPVHTQLSYHFESFPVELFTWNRKSRRVFHLPHSLQSVLAAATFPDIPWSDVTWPFDSFILTLEKPLQRLDKSGEIEHYDTVMVSKLPTVNQPNRFTIRALKRPKKPGVRLGMRPADMEKYNRLLKKGQYSKAILVCDKRRMETQELYPTIQGSFSVTLQPDSAFADFIRTEPEEIFAMEFPERRGSSIEMDREIFEADRERYELMSVLQRIVIGWMLYLESIPSQATEWRKPEGRKGRMISGGATSIITEPEHICNIVGVGRISTSEVTTESKNRCGKGFVRPHWRRSHTRRGAKKRIPATLIRADLVPLYGIIGGTKTIVIPEE